MGIQHIAHGLVRLLALAGMAALMLVSAHSAAGANNLSVSEQDFLITWNPLRWTAGGQTTSCPVILHGSFHASVMDKTAGSLDGHITAASVTDASCANGRATVLTGDLPWHVQYDSFSNELPEIGGVTFRIIGIRAAYDPTGSLPACLWGADTADPLIAIAELEEGGRGTITGLRADETRTIDLGGGFICEIAGSMRKAGTGPVRAGDDNNPVLITLEDALPAELDAAPRSVVVEELEASDRFTVTNVGAGSATATIDSQRLEGVDPERPEIEVRSTGCETRLVDGASCVYTVSVSDRSLERATYRIVYDDEVNEETSTLAIPIEIRAIEDDDPTAAPSGVTIDALEQNDGFTLRNEADGPVTIDRVVVTAEDVESPEFSVTSPGCRSTLNPRESCLYVVAVNARPEADGRVTIYYRDRDDSSEHALIVDVDIAEDPDPAVLTAEPSTIAIERLEANDSFVLRNTGTGTATATVDAVELVSDDRERPEFSVTGIGCTSIYIDGASCTYVVSVNSRPEADGRYVLTYDDGINAETRRTTVEIDIAS